MSLKSIWNCIFAPRLIQIYGTPGERSYEPHRLEKWSDQIINSIYMVWKLGVYTSPFIGLALYYRGYFEPQGLITITKFAAGIGVILVVSFCIRGFSRARNPTYRNFLDVLYKAQENVSETKSELMKYDFDFQAWPVEYDLSKSKGSMSKSVSAKNAAIPCSTFSYIVMLPIKVIAYLAIHTFGIRLIYPGTLDMLQAILENGLLQGRTRLISIYNSERFKLKTSDGNSIDTMFLDRRTTHQHGGTLVICSEGNAGFYEIGTMVTPIEAGYSVLGWNHPGFGGSTGMPYPSQEQNAMDAVMQFAINKLGFKVENILLFGWSIGGYTTAWAAMSYPEVKGVVIDASFDDIMPLAVNHMPKWWEPIVQLAVREYMNLDISGLLLKYPGPLMFIRRTKDEVICLRPGELSSNRGNDLLIKILRSRYPCIYEPSQLQLLNQYLEVTGVNQERILEEHNVDDNACVALMQAYVLEFSKNYPMKIGEDLTFAQKNQLALFLANKYMKDFKATHCVSLPWDRFSEPWDIHEESDFVFT